MNETRERLRKKLSQIVNARKNSKTYQAATAPEAATIPIEAHNQMDNVLNANEIKLFQQFQQQLPDLASWDVHSIAETFEQIHQAKRSEKLHDLCECLQHLQPNQKADVKTVSKKSQHKQAVSQKGPQTSLEPPNKKSNMSNNSTRDASTSSQSTKSRDHTLAISSSQADVASTISAPPTVLASTQATPKPTSNLDFVSEICEIIDNYSKEQAKRKWIKETLSFIEGPSVAPGKKKSQPQTLNPKKAAKKAKQKQRKDEEKRIAELQDLRGQFHNIYFKEFTEKLNLKSMKASKKRDKKRIGEMESNIKNLQRAKAKVETAIIELIATVKQTNAEFKFPYLPTKEQQVEKMKELEGQQVLGSKDQDNVSDKKIKITSLQQHSSEKSVPSTTPYTVTQSNNLNMVPEAYSMPYAHVNHFPYNLGFPPPAAPAPFGLMRGTPMCYAPPPPGASAQQQQLGPDVVAMAAMASSSTNSNSSNDPSKRIVTIRRVNLPNVPEPQVTVTAKGSSPDKDKLLYTFINGQLVQTGSAPHIAIPQMPITPVQPPITGHSTKMPPEHLLTIPPPPPPKLSKTQMKKERRRLAKLQAEAEEVERKRLEEENQKLKILEEKKQQQQQQLQQEQPKKKKKKVSAQQSQARQFSSTTSLPANKDSNNKLNHKQNKLATSNSTTSVSTNENLESSPQIPQVMIMQKATKQKRSVSTTTSCSVATSSSSNNSTSSQMNTRDNSVSSLKTGKAKSSINKRHVKEQKVNTCSNANAKNNEKVNSKKKHTPPTSSTVSSEDEYDKIKSPVASSLKQQQESSKSNNAIKNNAKQKSKSKQQKVVAKPITPPSSDTEEDTRNIVQPQIKQKNKVPKKRRHKLVDNGQFDNNPFKSLHMQDSETDWSSSEEDVVDNDECDVLEVQLQNLKLTSQTTSTESANISHKKETKTSKQTSQKINQLWKKNSDNDSKDLKSRNTPTTLDVSGKCAAKQKNKISKLQINEKAPVQTTGAKHNVSHNQFEDNIKSHSGRLSKNPSSSSTSQKAPAISNNRKAKNENRLNTGNAAAHNSKSNNNNINSTNVSRPQTRNNPRNSNRNQNSTVNTAQQQLGEHVSSHKTPAGTGGGGGTDNKNKRSQRNKKYQQKPQKSSQAQHLNCCSGIPNNMGYFNPNEVHITPSNSNYPLQSAQNISSQNCSYQSLAEQMQAMGLDGNLGSQLSATAPSATAQHQQRLHINNNNVSIMDQLNRGVQVENLSLPPGITLTKVDPVKSEQLRQKSESIKKLAKPLHQPQQGSQNPQTFHHSPMGTTIIAPPVTPMSNYYSSSYATNVGIIPTAALDPQSGIIMVEANPPKCNTASSTVTSATSSCNSKQSKNKKRRNKSKANNNGPCPLGNSGTSQDNNSSGIGAAQPKMITLRNPMFHGGPTAAPATIMQQSGLMSGK